MKLYTEEQVHKAYDAGMQFIGEDKGSPIEFFSSLTPIELPSEGDIIEASHTEIYQVTFNPFASGALWMRDKIKGGQDE